MIRVGTDFVLKRVDVYGPTSFISTSAIRICLIVPSMQASFGIQKPAFENFQRINDAVKDNKIINKGLTEITGLLLTTRVPPNQSTITP